MSTNKSEHLQLHLWEPGDSVLRTEFNENWQKLDASAAQAQADLTAGLAQIISDLNAGGQLARVAFGTYTGTGKYGSGNQNSLTFPFAPKVLILFPSQQIYSANYNYYGQYGVGVVQAGRIYPDFGHDNPTVLTLSGTTLRWYSSGNAFSQYNGAVPYYYVALG